MSNNSNKLVDFKGNDRYERLVLLTNLAQEQASKSMCKRKQVGSVLFTKSNLLPVSYGYGGAQDEPCTECVRDKYTWHQDGCWSIHAELRAIFNYLSISEINGVNLNKDGILKNHMILTTHGPCDQCLKYMHMFGITDVIYIIPYHDDYAKWGGKITVWSLEQYVQEHRGEFEDATIS